MKKVIITMIILLIMIIILVLGINIFVVANTSQKIISEDSSERIGNIDCILILGAGIWGDKPSHMLEDRLNEGIALYKKGVSNKIIMSGDHGQENYDEVNLMKKYAIEKGVPSEDIFMDHAGFSSYDSMYRAKEIFKVEKMIVVTQKYHMYRALYIANQLGIEAYGVVSNPREYAGQAIREVREILARDKDFVKCIFKPKAEFLGNTIPVNGNGDVTNDQDEKLI